VTTKKTRREELALAVLSDAITAAHRSALGVAPFDAVDVHGIRSVAHNRLLKVLRYYGKPRRKPTGRKSGSVSSRVPGANTDAVFPEAT
jgi:hypothetical protein